MSAYRCRENVKGAVRHWKKGRLGILEVWKEAEIHEVYYCNDPHKTELRKFFDKNLLRSVIERLTDRCHLRKHLYILGSFVPPEAGVEALTKRSFVLRSAVAP